MVAACQEAAPHFGDTSTKIDRADLFTAASVNGSMLKRLKSLTRINSFAARMREQVVALHNKIRLPHVGVSRSVRYDQLYVQPKLASEVVVRLGAPGERVLVQGDPGAGKSTLAAKFAHDVASDGTGRVPFLLVLREFTAAFDEGGRDLLHYLEKVCQAPYNVKPPHDGVEYLLRTGRAVVILDGLDELVQTELRRRVVSLVEGFAHLYPLVPILITARKVGYDEAPLSADQFVPSQIERFSDEQVTEYVTRWFVLDDATSPAERERLSGSFVEDSEQIPELRSNPLLLTLLCAMYSSDRYLPRNLAQVYERCALMLFEQWDSRRGIPLPLRFQGRLRGAVQHLAWRMFTAPESGKALPRTRIINTLTGYLDTKLDDHDESVAMAEEFLSFCTGRAWILTDVGATESEPQFGFTHRTFLEYFAAEHITRTHRTADSLWATLKPNINQWDVVAQIVLQLYDRNVEGGADELLTEALDDGGLAFAARSLHYVNPTDRTVRSITTAALNRSVLAPAESRIDLDLFDGVSEDEPLRDCMHSSSPANRPTVEQVVVDRLTTFIARGEVGALLVLDTMPHGAHGDEHARWTEVQHELQLRHRELLLELRKATPWMLWTFRDPEVLDDVVRRFGARALYTECKFHESHYIDVAHQVLKGAIAVPPMVADRLATTIASLPTPWAERDLFDDMDMEDLVSEEPDNLQKALSLPLLEMKGLRRTLPSGWLNDSGIPPAVREFLLSWERGEINVLLPGPEPQHPLPEQH